MISLKDDAEINITGNSATATKLKTPRTINGTSFDGSKDITITATDPNAIPKTQKGAANGVAELDSNGLVPSSQLPSYVDDILEYSAKSNFPTTGETGKIYVDTSKNITYRWSGSTYVEISPSLALGTTSSTAFRGDYGNTAYTHATDSSKLTTATSSGLYKVASTAKGHIASLTAVTKADITGLGIPGSDTNTTYTFATGDSNGQIKVTPSGGSTQNVTVKGLAAGAYKGVDTSIAAASTSTNLPTSKAVASLIATEMGKVSVDGVITSSNDTVDNIVSLTKAQYNALTTKEKNTLYNITDDISDEEDSIDMTQVIDIIYPVGSIYISANTVNPSTFLGGAWEQIKDRFLLAAGDSYAAGTTGGEARHTLTVNEMPSHTHIQNPHSHSVTASGSWNSGATARLKREESNSTHSMSNAVNNTTATNKNTGGGQAHNNMPPYLAVYMWKRLS